MSGLLKEYFCERKSILTVIIFGAIFYIFYSLIFFDSEIGVAIFTTFIASSMYGQLINKRKENFFETFLITTPIGRKGIVNSVYLISIISNILVVFVFYILFIIRSSIGIIPLLELETLYFFSSNSTLITFIGVLGVGLISSAILFPFYVLSRKESKILMTLISWVALIVSVGLLHLFNVGIDIFTQDLRMIMYVILSGIIFAISYLITMKFYLKKDI